MFLFASKPSMIEFYQNDIIVFIAFILLAIWVCWRLYNKREDLLNNHLCFFGTGLFIFFVIFAIAILEHHCCHTKNPPGNSTFVSLFSLFGIMATLVGLFIAYKQFKLSEDRINGYDRLYETLISILKEGEEAAIITQKMRFSTRMNDFIRYLGKPKKIDRFQFYGTTLIPGDIAYNNNNEKKKYVELIVRLAGNLKEKFEIMLPSDDLLSTTYSPYTHFSSDTDKKIEDIIKLKDEIRKQGGHVFEVRQKSDLQYIGCSRDFRRGFCQFW